MDVLDLTIRFSNIASLLTVGMAMSQQDLSDEMAQETARILLDQAGREAQALLDELLPGVSPETRAAAAEDAPSSTPPRAPASS